MERNKLLGEYSNGNHHTRIYADGTRIRETYDPMDTEMVSEFPESIDLKITNKCNLNCPMCHEDSVKSGNHSDLMGLKFIDTIPSFTEIAIGGGNPLSHPQLVPFLYKLKERNVLPSITVHQDHLRDNDIIPVLVKDRLIYGLGVSVSDVKKDTVQLLSLYPNTVVHVVNGVLPVSEFRKLYGNGLKVLLLGYKELRRGKSFYTKQVRANKEDMVKEVRNMLSPLGMYSFHSISFDNLAIDQLLVDDVKKTIDMNTLYQGDDGEHSMYVDAVDMEYASSSLSEMRLPVTGDIVDMFRNVKKMSRDAKRK